MARPAKHDPPAIQKLTALRAKILQLAVQGKLVPQVPSDEPASKLLERIATEREALVKSGKLRKPKSLPKVDPDGAPTLPQGWEMARLGDQLLSMDSGWSPKCEERQPAADEWGVLKTNAVSTGTFLPQEAKALPSTMDPRPALAVVDGDYVLTRGSGSVDRMARGLLIRNPPERLMLSDLHIRIRFVEPRQASWWEVVADSFEVRNQFESQSSGTSTMRKITKHQLQRVVVPIPPLAEQGRIVAKVNELMAAIDELEAYLRRIEALRPKILQLAVQGKLVPQDASEEPGSALLERIAAAREELVDAKRLRRPKPLPPVEPDEVRYGLPQSWEWTRLGAVCVKITDGTHHSPPNGPRGEVMYVTAKNVRDGFVDFGSATWVAREVHNEIYARCDPEFEDVLFVKDGATTGLTAVNPAREPFSLLSSVALLKRTEDIDPFYLMHAMRSPLFQRAIRGKMAGAAITRVTLAKINVAVVPLPPLAEQRRIVAEIEAIMASIDALQGRVR